MINIGAYVDGSDPELDFAKSMIVRINAFLQQDIHQKVSFQESVARLQGLFSDN